MKMIALRVSGVCVCKGGGGGSKALTGNNVVFLFSVDDLDIYFIRRIFRRKFMQTKDKCSKREALRSRMKQNENEKKGNAVKAL